MAREGEARSGSQRERVLGLGRASMTRGRQRGIFLSSRGKPRGGEHVGRLGTQSAICLEQKGAAF